MTRDDIIRLALEAQACRSSFNRWTMYASDLERFAALIAAAEREACAKVCDNRAYELFEFTDPWFELVDCAAAIRARGAAQEDKA